MAGDWIKVEISTPDKPEVHRMSNVLGVTPEHVVGCLLRVWMWADVQTLDGNAVNVTDVTLDRIACNAGFASAMREVGWLTGENGSLVLPNFERHNGETAKKRALTKERVKRFRNADGVTREEKRREEGNLGVGVGFEGSTPTSSKTAGKGERAELREAARRVLAFLNEKAGKRFEDVDANLDLIVARLKEKGGSEDACRQVIAAKCREWGGDPEKAVWLRPATLFAARNFAQYKGQLGAPERGGQ